MGSYEDFIAGKSRAKVADGFRPESLNPNMFDFQRRCVERACEAGRFALFEDCGLGKSLQQASWAHAVCEKTGGSVLIVAPLCVTTQTLKECAKFGIDASTVDGGSRIEVTNYERLHKIDPSKYSGVVLDESSILKSLDGKTRGLCIEMFGETPYKLACTATPAPNDITEIGNHAEFLGVMSNAEMLASFFVNKGHGRQSWKLKGHATEGFYEWMSTWSIFLSKPSDIGGSDDGYNLPPLNFHGHFVESEAKTDGHLFFMGMGGIQDRSAIRKKTIGDRVEKAIEIARSETRSMIVWCGLNAEQDAVARALGDDCVSISGSDKTSAKMSKINDFIDGKARVLVTKPKIVGFGMNFQHAPCQVFVGLGDSYESYYQAVRRSYRFGQTDSVDVHIVLSDVEREVLDNVKRKESRALEIQRDMAGRMAKYQSEMVEAKLDSTIEKKSGEGWTVYHGDCIEVMRSMDAESVDLSVFSPPFSSLYTYSASPRDMGNCKGTDEFFEHFRHFGKELARVMKPGRLVACHCQQLPLTKATDGVIGVVDFRGMLIDCFKQSGFIYHGEVCIDKCPQAQAIRTKNKGLLFVQLEKDSSWSRPAFADYIILLRTPGDNPDPIKNDLTREEWIEWARPIWYGITESDTLSTVEARDDKDEKHVCPLQLGTIERCVRLWSNPGELVFSPFTGIGSEGYQSILSGRRFMGAELKPSYFRVACKNLRRAVKKSKEGTLFGNLGEVS